MDSVGGASQAAHSQAAHSQAARAQAVVGLLAANGRVVDSADIERMMVPLDALNDAAAITSVAVAHGLETRDRGASVGEQVPPLTPGPVFVADSADVRRGIVEQYRGAAGALLFTLVVGLTLVIPGLAVPALVRYFVDTVLVAGDRDRDGAVVVLLVGAAVVQFALGWLLYATHARLAQRITIRNSANFVWHLLRLPARVVASVGAGTLAMRSAVNQRTGFIAGMLAPGAALNVVSVVFYLGAMVVFDPFLTAVTLVILVVNAVVVRQVFRRRGPHQNAVLDASVDLDAITVAGIEAAESIKATASKHEYFVAWSAQRQRLAVATSRLGLVSQVLAAIPTMVQVVALAVVVSVGALQVMNGDITLGTLVAFQGLLAAVLVPVNQLSYSGVLIQNMAGQVQQRNEVLFEPVDIELAVASVVPSSQLTPLTPSPLTPSLTPSPQTPLTPSFGAGRLSGSVQVRGLTFGFDPAGPALIEGLDLDVSAGRRLALVGRSGSGKSTVARLLTGQLEPWAGSVSFDGVNRALLPRAVLARSVAYVAQEVTLLEGSVADNITMFDPSISSEQVVRAAADAGLLDEIAARPGGLASPVDPGGRNLSGGQRQRLAIARALATDPAVSGARRGHQRPGPVGGSRC